MTVIANVPAICSEGLALGSYCIPWLLVGLILGAVLLSGTHLFRASRQYGRTLDESQVWPGAPAVPSPRVSVIRLIPTAEGRNA